jgi:hypothetical protein
MDNFTFDNSSAVLAIYFVAFFVGVLINCVPMFIAAGRRVKDSNLVAWFSIGGMLFWPLFFVALILSLIGETYRRPYPSVRRTMREKFRTDRAAMALEEMAG